MHARYPPREASWTESNTKHPNLAQQSIPNPQHQVGHIVKIDTVEIQDAGIERRAVPEDKQVFHEPARVLDVGAEDAEHRQGLLEVDPAAGEHTRPHSLSCMQKREHVAQYGIWQGTDAVGGSHCRLLALRHRVEHASAQICETRNGRDYVMVT
jgi:hypothetical protein